MESTSSLELFVAGRLIPLYKRPRLRPVGVGEALQEMASKAVIMLWKDNVMHAAGTLQLSADEDIEVEAVVQAIHDVFPKEMVESVFFLIDAENTVFSLNEKVMKQ